MLCLGIDIGTTTAKALVLDVGRGKVLALIRQQYGIIEAFSHGHAEQTPQEWIQAADRVVRECLSQLGERRREIVAVGVSAQQHGLVALDAKNEPVRPAKLWCDTSTAAQAEELNRAFGGAEELIRRTGNAMVPGYTAPKLLWLKQNEAHNFRRIRTVLLPHDYLNFWLTRERQMEYGDASGTGLLDVRTRNWYRPLIDYIDEDLFSKLPALRPSTGPSGLLRETLRREWDLKGEILVSAGGGDNMLAAIGTGNIKPNVISVSLGSSGTVFSFVEEPVADPKGELALFCDATDHWLILGCTMNVAVAIEQIQKLFRWDVPTLEEKVGNTPPGADGLLVLPYLRGERLPNLPGASGVFHGLTTQNMNAAEMARAVVEGVTMVLAYGFKRMTELGIKPAELRLTGGGSKSRVWRKIVADVFGCPAVAMKVSEAAALGAAVHAAWAYGLVKGKPVVLDKIVRDAVKIDKKTRVDPEKENHALYTELQARQRDLTQRLATSGYL